LKNKFCFDLKLPISGPLNNFKCIYRNDAEPDIFFIDHSDVSEDYKNWISECGLIMTYPPLIFYTPIGHQIGVHIDGPGKVMDRACMNWCVQGAGSLMHWYEVKAGCSPFEETETQAGTPYTQYHPKDLNHLHSQTVKWPSVVQTGIPHNVHNSTWEPRWTISCDLSFKDTPEQGLTMFQAQEIFFKWMI